MTGILHLRVELCLQIHQELVNHDRPYKVHPWMAIFLPCGLTGVTVESILGVDRQINQEAMGLFYGMNQL